MVRHVSVFTFKKESPDGRSKAENVAAVRAFLENEVPALSPMIQSQYIGAQAAPAPDLPDEAPVMFGDLIQVADFASPEDAAAYPASEGHVKLTELATPMLRKVTAIDYVI